MKKICFVILLMFIIQSISLSNNTNTINYFKKTTKNLHLKRNELVAFFFLSFGMCYKCMSPAYGSFECFELKNKNYKIKIIGILSCDRKKEIKSFYKQYKWDYPLIIDTISIKQKLSLPDNTVLSIFNFKGKNLKSFSIDKLKSDIEICDELLKLFCK